MQLRVVLVVVVVVLQLGRGAAPAGGAEGPEPVRYTAPVPGPVVDPWRGPATPFGSGNRGVDLAADPGDAVRAAADGEVVFAGAVGGSHHVVLLHPDGLRTTYAFLAATAVRRGDAVTGGQAVGTAAGPVHFGVRAGTRYLDPSALLAGPPRVHLVPAADRRPGSEADERRGLLGVIGGALRVGAGAADWLAGTVADGVESGADLVVWAGREGWTELAVRLEALMSTARLAAGYLRQPVELLAAVRAMAAYRADQAGCTPAGRRPPRRPERRIAVLVAGFGSDGEGDAIAGLDTDALGYAEGDVAQFSYAGGQVARDHPVEGVPVGPGYRPADAEADFDESAAELRRLLRDIGAAHPGVPVDVIAHSAGGLVARAALAGGGRGDPAVPMVANLVTIGTPHTGADLATASAWVSSSGLGGLAVAGIGAVTGADPFSPAAHAMVEGSPFLVELADRPVRAARFTSIASAGDLTVTANHSAVGDAVNVLVPGRPGPAVHDRLPGSSRVRREIDLALAGLGPTCRSLVADTAQVVAVSTVEDLVGGATGAAALYADRWLSATARPRPDRGTGAPARPAG
ncbi:MAG: peptidoglycan DD-metalloendopeptidase family protein [Acidimicrobiia bacterium]